jgi:tetrapyrrole methylase family protein/MazG family protein
MSEAFVCKESYGVDDLADIVARLRGPGGCPWDQAQTHQSIRKNLIEETYEVVEAINRQNPEMLCEELGDVLLQVALHAEMARARGDFDLNRVADGICKKLIERHPHVFGGLPVAGVEAVLANWDTIKRGSKGHKTTAQAMRAVPRELPALMRAQKLQQKAEKAGLAGVLPGPVAGLDKLGQEELGALLFAAANALRAHGADAEEALTLETDRFLARFAQEEHNLEQA